MLRKIIMNETIKNRSELIDGNSCTEWHDVNNTFFYFSRTHMFGVPGQHTFFLPVDSAFDVSVQLTGYDYERGRPTGLNKMGVSTVINIFDKVGHIRYKCNTFEINIRSQKDRLWLTRKRGTVVVPPTLSDT